MLDRIKVKRVMKIQLGHDTYREVNKGVEIKEG